MTITPIEATAETLVELEIRLQQLVERSDSLRSRAASMPGAPLPFAPGLVNHGLSLPTPSWTAEIDEIAVQMDDVRAQIKSVKATLNPKPSPASQRVESTISPQKQLAIEACCSLVRQWKLTKADLALAGLTSAGVRPPGSTLKLGEQQPVMAMLATGMGAKALAADCGVSVATLLDWFVQETQTLNKPAR